MGLRFHSHNQLSVPYACKRASVALVRKLLYGAVPAARPLLQYGPLLD